MSGSRMVEVPSEVIERLSTKGIVVGTIVDKEALAELRAFLDAPAKPVAPLVIAPLVWTEPAAPNDEIRYDHVIAETPLGRFSIEWKSWKQFDSYSVHLDGDYLEACFDLETAKKQAFERYQGKIMACLVPEPFAPELTDLLKIQMELLNWNRAQPNQSILIGHEYAVAEQALKIMGKAPAPRPEVNLELALDVFEKTACKQTYQMREGVRAVIELCGREAVVEPMVKPFGYPPVPEDRKLPVGTVCKGSAALGTACGKCERCERERERAATVPKHKFDCLVEHAKRLDDEIANQRRVINDVTLYQDNAVWFWQGGGQDFLESLTCPVVIPARELRALRDDWRKPVTMQDVMRACERQSGYVTGTSNWCAHIASELNIRP